MEIPKLKELDIRFEPLEFDYSYDDREKNTKAEDKCIAMAIQGSRMLSGKRICDIIHAEVERHKPQYIVTSGEAYGVCEEARKYCRRNAVPLKLHFLNRGRYAAGAWHHRSLAIIEECDFVVFIHDGNSVGTQNEMELAERYDKRNSYHFVRNENAEEEKTNAIRN